MKIFDIKMSQEEADELALVIGTGLAAAFCLGFFIGKFL